MKEIQLPFIEEYEILFISIGQYDIPKWIEINVDGRSHRVGLNSNSFTIDELKNIAKNVGRYYRGRVMVKQFGDNRYEAIFMQPNPDYVEPEGIPMTRKEALEMFETRKKYVYTED